MTNKAKNNSQFSFGVLVLLLLMVALGGMALWLAVPFFAQSLYGEPADYLTPTQRWMYSAQILSANKKLTQATCAASSQSALPSFNIEMGDSVNLIAEKLQAAGLISDASSFRDYLIYKGMDTNILAGTYSFSCALTPVQIAAAIQNPYLENVVFDILPGWRAEEIAAALNRSGIEVSAADFLAVVQNPSGLQLPAYLPAGQPLEGFLFPGEYTVPRQISAQQLAQMMIDRFDQEITSTGLNTEASLGLDFYQKVILASIVQRESYDADERPIIASVFYNRLNSGMKLETDPTVQYALGYSNDYGWWKSPLSLDDLQVQSNYNTYLIAGLPPTPIANPDLSALAAVVNPATTDYLYFRAKCDGSGTHVFAQTLEEQNNNACQ
ncbi:MAG: endolytic transglycosylase MltG [Anaerolineaceae bacterium]|nr:endolytic transglycosylase MltG [Anaerolineaceae bacterium]